tara:strand:- start:4093 stop:4479 length:387 start_codon:yes stop_codon:yes gene_type:complete
MTNTEALERLGESIGRGEMSAEDFSEILFEVQRQKDAELQEDVEVTDFGPHIEMLNLIVVSLRVQVERSKENMRLLQDAMTLLEQGGFNVLIEHYAHISLDLLIDHRNAEVLANSLEEELKNEGFLND